MSDNTYARLREAIARHSAFFPATTAGIEFAFLRKLFSAEEAEMYINLGGDLEATQDIAKRTCIDHETVSKVLKRMAEKSLVFPKRDGDAYYYAAAPFAHGILEGQVNRLDGELARIYEDYIWAEKVPEERTPEQLAEPLVPLRSIPVKAPLSVERPIAPYEDVKEIIKNQDRIALAECFCAKQQKLLNTGCERPLEVCMLLGFYAEYYIDLKLGRKISRDEALAVLDITEEASLVHQIPNSLDPGAICNCCPDCCGGLRVLKKLPSPSLLITSNHYCKVNGDACDGCGICETRCSMGAVVFSEDGKAGINTGRCIGCGLCINTCPSGAMTLASKQDKDRKEPPNTLRFMRSSRDIESNLK